MNTLVIYDSQYGNTERIAQTIAESCRATGSAQAVRVDPDRLVEIDDVDLLIVGCPTQAWRPTPAMQALLARLDPERLRGMAMACFDTRFQKPRWLTGSAARRMGRTCARMGATLIAPPESFFVDGKEGPLLAGEQE